MKTKRTAQLPPFFTHVIGSLPRPKFLQDLVARREQMPAARYKQILDELVLVGIRMQEEAGMDVVSDGEWRRTHYTEEFLKRLGGFEKARRYENRGEVRMFNVAVGKMTTKDPVFVEDAEFLVKHTDRCTKFALPSPFMVAIRYWHPDHSKHVYPTYQHLMEAVAERLAVEAKALVKAGIDMIQLDDPALTYFCDRRLMTDAGSRDDFLARDWNIDKQFPDAVKAINQITDGLNAEVHLHCCHSVYKRRSDVLGDYKPILPRLKDAKIDRINLEFAYNGTGMMNDLEYLPKHIDVGMGVVDVRGERLQTIDEIEALGAAGAALLPASRISLNPDCGFAPDAGEPPTIDEAWEKLCRLSAAAKRLRERFAGSQKVSQKT